MAPDSEPTPRVPWLPVNEGTPPAATPTAEGLTPSKPIVPAWIQRDAVPQPIEDADAEIIAPVDPPSAEELLPSPVEAPLDEFTEPEVPSRPRNADPVHRLGASAVASAELSAAGAPTPLGGVPTVPADSAVEPPAFGDDDAPFTPNFEDEPKPTHREKADALAAGIVAQEQAKLATTAGDLDGGVAYAPLAFGATTDSAIAKRAGAEVGELTPEEATQGDDGTPPSGTKKKRRWWLLVLLALLVAAGVLVLVALLDRPEATVIPGVTVTEPPPSATITPTPAPTGTTFQASMPTTVGTYALVAATALDPADIALTAGRVADGVDLTYRSGDDTMTVRALQYYNEDDATAMFTQFAGEGAATQPVEAGGAVVGESAVITAPDPGMVWRNGTSVFILTGPVGQIADFYAQFGL